MKSKPNPASLLKPLLSVAAGIAIGWWGKGMVTGRGGGQQGTVPPTAEISRTGSSSADSLTSQSPSGVNAEESKAVAKRLLQAALDDSPYEGSDELFRFHFQEALAECDEAAVAEMLESLIASEKDPAVMSASGHPFFRICFQLLVGRLAAMNPRKALDCEVGLAQAGVDFGPEGFYLVMELLAAKDPTHVQSMIEGIEPAYARISAEIAWLHARTRNDPEGVFQYLMNLDPAAPPIVSLYDTAMSDLLRKLAVQDPGKALQVCARFSQDSFFSTRTDLQAEWVRREPKAATQWAMDQNNADMFNAWFQSDAQGVSGLDEKFLRDNFLAIQENMPNSRAALAQKLASRLAKQDIPEAIRWAATLPAVEQEAANCGVAIRWIGKDAAAAAEWLATWPPGESRDTMVSLLSPRIAEEDPEAGLAWAASMQSGNRYDRMQKAMDVLTAKDPAAAVRAFQSLSEDDRAVLSVMKGHKELFK